jgi:hypothetical protein
MAAAPVFSRHGVAILAALAFPLIVLMVAAAYCFTGYFISRRRRLGAGWALRWRRPRCSFSSLCTSLSGGTA